MSSILGCIEQEPSSPATASIIWMHGLGATAHDFESIPPELGLPDDLAVRYVFPQAPSIPVTLNGGMVMPAWYDIHSLAGNPGASPQVDRNRDEAGVRRSEGQIKALIDREIDRGIPAERIVLAGFSQGGAMALHTALRFSKPLAGAMVLSGYLLLHEKLDDEASDANRNLSIFQAHGAFDPMVRPELAVLTKDLLTRGGWQVEWHEYPMGHQVCLEEIQAIGTWLQMLLG